MTVELPREKVAEIKPHALLPDDYEDEGFAGGGPCEEVGQRITNYAVKRRRVDVFVRGKPEGCPYDSREEVRNNTEPGTKERWRWLYGSDEPGPEGTSFWCDYIPEECPFCLAEIDRTIGTLLDRHGLDYGVTHCPECQRIFGVY